jgi:uncharacterized protein YegP (UPF0339 family)
MKIKITKHGWLRQKWHFSIVANNGKTVAQSENYRNYDDMMDTIQLLKKECATARIQLVEDD